MKKLKIWSIMMLKTQKTLFLKVLFFLVSTNAYSQEYIGSLTESSPKYIPGSMTSDGAAILYSREWLDGGNYRFALYNTSMNNFRTLSLSPTKYAYAYKREERKPQVMTMGKNERQLFDGQQFDTWEAFVEAVTNYNGTGFQLVTKNNNQLWPADNDPWSYWEYEQFGAQYPRGYYEWRDDKTAWIINPEYTIQYTGDWEVVEENNSTIGDISYMRYKNYDDANAYSHEDFYLTQTLFNNDANFEYLEPVYDESAVEVLEYDRDGMGLDDVRETHKGSTITGFNVVSDNGNVVLTFKAESGYTFSSSTIYCIRMGGQHYMVFFQNEKSTGKSFYAYYRINKIASSVEKVAIMPMQVNPMVASQSDNITVELGESNTAKEIEIINASGQLVKRIPIAKGQKSVTFGAQGITRGLNMVRASGDKNNVTKIIIK
ncbi:MAG: T9SS type A sorting domain-containing protein [Prevotella sp.]|nr:T9SS type A sorting domain-containing protein [Clostridium lundense]MBE6249365.1 T9SS type A sorting domain-containing protein [Prevotella sp.]MBQ2673422.1 T9SS type A sorting domain-containing protein [Prevotella sp.]